MSEARAATARRAGFMALADGIAEILKDHPRRDVILEGFREARRLIEAEGVDAARARLLAPDESVDLVCPRCKGAGWLRLDLPAGAADFGTIAECRCGLVAAGRAERNLGRSRIPAEYADLDLSTFPDRRIGADIIDWWHERPSPWLLLCGDLGVGKTGLTIGLVKRALADGKTALFRPTTELLGDIRATYRTRDASEPGEADMMRSLKEIDLLALDDVGTERMTGWVQERIFEVLNHRYNERRRTVISTNLGPDELGEHVGERVMSRIVGMGWRYEILGPNLRERAS